LCPKDAAAVELGRGSRAEPEHRLADSRLAFEQQRGYLGVAADDRFARSDHLGRLWPSRR